MSKGCKTGPIMTLAEFPMHRNTKYMDCLAVYSPLHADTEHDNASVKGGEDPQEPQRESLGF